MWAKLGLFGIACGTGLGCFTAPARSSGPSEWDGVQMAIVGQYCEEEQDPDWIDNEVVQLRMKIGVTNRSTKSVDFDPDRVRVIGPDRVTPSPVAADSPLTVGPGETKVAAVRFMNRGSLKCQEEIKLDPSDSVRADAKPVPLRPIVFVAHNGS